MNRRLFLKATTTCAIGQLSGCCTLSNLSSLAESDTRIATNLSIPASQGTKTGLGIDFLIDTHAHFFNATDMQTAGYFSGPIASSVPENLRVFVKLLSPIIELLSRNTLISVKSEYEYIIDEFGITEKSRSEVIDPEKLLKSVIKNEEISIKSLTKAINDPSSENAKEIRKEFFKLIKQEPGEKSYFKRYLNEKNEDEDIPEKFIRNSIWGEQSGSQDIQNLNGNQKISSSYSTTQFDMMGVFYFVIRMLSFRHVNLFRYRETYSTESAFGVNACFGALVDFDYFVGCHDHPCSLIQDQIILNKKLIEMFPNYYFPLISYNPWTDIKKDDEALEIVVSAVTEHQFIGVKIYPSIGYYPYGNEGRDQCTRGDDPARQPDDLKEVDLKLEALYKKANQLDIPVMGHSGAGMGQTVCTADYGRYDAWKPLMELLKKHQETNAYKNRSKINFAHFGSRWEARNFAEHMKKYKQLKLYADLGYWTSFSGYNLVSIGMQEIPAKKTDKEPAKEIVFDRIMFGTDWLMLSKEKESVRNAYPFQMFSKIKNSLSNWKGNELEKEAVIEILNKIAYINALAFFNMELSEEDGKTLLVPKSKEDPQ